MSRPDQNSQPEGITLAARREDIKLQQAAEEPIFEGVFLDTDIQFLREYIDLGTKLPSSENAFQDGFRTESIEKYLGDDGEGTCKVG